MSKALKKLIDINGLREFKNKLVGADSVYVQTAAVDQTISGTKTFSKPIVGSVTGSSGSCTGNAATATTAAAASSVPWSGVTGKPSTFTPSSHTHDDRYYTENEVNNLLNGKANTSGTYSNLTVGNAGSATNAGYANWLRTSSHSDHLFHTEWDNAGYFWTYVTAGDGGYRAVRVARSDSAATADRASAANGVSSSDNNHTITFDWSGQVPGCVGLRVDATNMGGIVTTEKLSSKLGSVGTFGIGSTILAPSDVDYAGGSGNYGEQVAGSHLTKSYGLDDTGGSWNGSTPSCPGTWIRVSGISPSHDSGSKKIGLWRRIA